MLKILSHCNFLRDSVTWEPLFHFPDEETEGEKAEGNYLRLNWLGCCIPDIEIYLYNCNLEELFDELLSSRSCEL